MKRRLLTILLACTVLLSLCGTVSAASSGSTFIWPTDSHSLARGFSNKHLGIDVSVAAETPIYASRAGTVYKVYNGCNNFSALNSKTGQTCRSKGVCNPGSYTTGGICNDGFGNGVIIKHPDGSYTSYAHLSPNSITVKVNDVVSQGQVIGKSGSSGSSTGPHLHFSLLKASKLEYWPSYYAGNSVDPVAYFNGNGQNTSTVQPSINAVTTGADTITQTSAILRGFVSSTGAKMTQCGMLLGTSKDNMTRLGYDSINTYSTTCFYSTSKYGRTLKPETTYYYQVYVVADGKEYKGDIRSFTTSPQTTTCTNHVKGTYLWYAAEHPHYDHYICAVCGQQFRDTTTNYVSSCEICNPEPQPCNHVKGKYLWYAAVHPHYDHYTCAICGEQFRDTATNYVPSCKICKLVKFFNLGASNITASSARLDASCAYTGSRPTSVGVFLGTSPSNMQIDGSDGNINHNKNPFDIWYNLSGLSAGTTYYYRFYAVVDGNVIYSDIKSFTTSAR